MSEDTHRVVRKAHTRSTSDPGPGETFEVGDTLTPTEAELDAFGDRFEALDTEGDETDEDATSEAAGADEGEDTSDDTDAATDATGDEAGEESEAPEAPPDPLTAEWVEDAEYGELRGAASRFEDVNGNWGEDRLRAELLDRTE